MAPGTSAKPRVRTHPMRWLLVCLALGFAWLAPSLASAQSCVAGDPINRFPFTPGVDNAFTPGDSRVTNASFNGVAGDVLSFQANPGGANSQIQLLRASNNAAVIATIAFAASTTYTVTAADVAQFPYQMRITNNSTVNQTYVINCAPGVTPPAPTVTAINPTSGTTEGGTAAVITGTNFTGATAVSIGGAAATAFTVVNATTINATTPAHAPGAVNVAVTTPGGTGTGVGLFTYVAPPAAPTVTAINPTSGPTGGGTPVTITGTNFTGATSVAIGGVAATSVTVVSATSITATTPAHAAGVVDVVVITPGGVGTGVGLFTYVAPPNTPTVTAINPPRGVTSGGTAVTITGTNFTGATAVTIGGVAATFTVVSDTSISATTGAHAPGIVDVVVTTPNGSGAGVGLFTYVAPAAPTVTAITPASGPTAGGTSVNITGTTFTGATSVTIGGAAASFTVVNPTTITATTPVHAAGAVDVVVTTPGGVGTGVGLFTYIAPPGAPVVAAINPTSGPTAGGTAVTITGANFTDASAVTIGGVAAAFTVVNDTTITATTAVHAAGVADVAVTTPNGTGVGAGLFTYIAPPAPTVTAVDPASGPAAGGTAVTITGANFTGATAVTIGGVAASAFAVVNDTTIAATTPAHAAGAADVAVTTPNGTGIGAGLFTYLAPPAAPTVGAISPTSGPVGGGTDVIITGTNFTGATVVTIGGIAATTFTVANDTTINATTPAHTAGAVDVAVTTPNGTGTGAGLFTYIAPPVAPTIASVNPGSGSTGGGTVITIVGTGFAGATAVTVGGVNALGFTVASDTTMTATTTAHDAGVVDVAVTGPNGTGVGAGLFTYVAPAATPRRAVETIGGFLGRRNMLIASSEPDSNREIDRLLEAQNAGGGAGFAGNNAYARPVASGQERAPSMFGGIDASDHQAGRWPGRDIGPPRLQDGLAEPRNWQFAASLSDIAQHYASAQVRRAADAGYRLGVSNGAARANPFDVWIEGTYADFSDDGFASGVDGHFGLVSLGADYVVNSRLLVGAMLQYDTMSERSEGEARAIEGQGWMAGPYATLRLGDGIFWRVRAAWGQSSNDVRPFLTYTDHFDSDRWLVSSRLTGHLEAGRWTLRPFASVFYLEDNAQSYVDSDGLTVPEVRSRFGQIAAGPEVSYRYELDTIQLEPRLALSIATTFANEANASGFGQIDGAIVGDDDVRTRAEIGVRAMTYGGLALDLSGAYDGIGSDFEAYSARLTLRMPLN